jgi:cellobiose phosphorylase
VTEGESGNSEAHGWSPVASHSFDIELAPGESREIVFVLGYVEMPEDDKWESKGVINKTVARDMIARFATGAQVDAALADLRSYWDGLLERFVLESGDRKLDRMVNIWNQYQIW